MTESSEENSQRFITTSAERIDSDEPKANKEKQKKKRKYAEIEHDSFIQVACKEAEIAELRKLTTHAELKAWQEVERTQILKQDYIRMKMKNISVLTNKTDNIIE